MSFRLLSASLMILAGLVLSAPAPAPPQKMRLHFINVGQGAATLVELPCGAMLLDTGGEENESFHGADALKAYLDAFFARRSDLKRSLDLLLLTHPHIDHMRGLPVVAANYSIKNVVENGQPAREPEEAVTLMRSFQEFLGSQKMPHQTVSLDDFQANGHAFSSAIIDPFPSCKGVDPKISVLWGRVPSDPGWGEDSGGKAEFVDENNHSIVTRVDFGESSMLLTGDLEIPAIRSMIAARAKEAIDADIYVVGHHGSHNGSNVELLQAISPEWAVIEMGPSDRKHSWTAWQYGHPRQVTVELLDQEVSRKAPPREVQVGTGQRSFSPESLERAIYGTGWDGNILLEADASGNIVRGAADVIGM